MSPDYDLAYDPNEVGTDMVVEFWISHSPRRTGLKFRPSIGDWIMVGDDAEPPRSARIIKRDGNRVWAQIDLPRSWHVVAN